MGKTTLALHWAHRIAADFPDGVLHADLRGFTPSTGAAEPTDVLRAFLEALPGAPKRLPVTLDALAGLYRSLLADRQMLVLLDNARDATQVRSLLPASARSLTVVTSRSQLPGLVAVDDGSPVAVRALPDTRAEELLAARIDRRRLLASPDALARIVARCGGLPLALAIVAARAAIRPDFPLEALATELESASGPLDALRSEDPASDVRGAFATSYAALSPAAAELFPLLGLHPGPEITTAAAASLLGVPLADVTPLLRELATANLVLEPVAGRFGLHDLLRSYASGIAARHRSARDAAVERLLDHYVHTAYPAALHADPQLVPIDLGSPAPGVTVERLPTVESAMAWFAAEQRGLMAAIDLAEEAGHDRHVWQLGAAVNPFFVRQWRIERQARMQRAAVAAAERSGSLVGNAHALLGLGHAYGRLGRYAEAYSCYDRALALFTRLDDTHGEAYSYYVLGLLCHKREKWAAAVPYFEQTLELHRRVGNRIGESSTLNALGYGAVMSGDPSSGLELCMTALDLLDGTDDLRGLASTWDSLACGHARLGQYEQAAACYEQALLASGTDPDTRARALEGLGDVRDALGDGAGARREWLRALEILRRLAHPHADAVRAKLLEHDVHAAVRLSS